MTAAEKILILLSLCDHWTWCRPVHRAPEPDDTETDRIRPVAVVTLAFDGRQTQFTYGPGLNDLDKYRFLLVAIHRLDVPLPDFACEDLAFLATA